MRIVLLFFFFVLAALAQPTVSSHTESAVEDTDAHISVVLSAATDVYIRYHTSTFLDCVTGTVWKRWNDGGSGTTREWILYGLTKNTQYFYAVCRVSDNLMLTGGSPPYTFTTTNSASVHPVRPTPPTTTGITGITPSGVANTDVTSSCQTNLQAAIDSYAAIADSSHRTITVDKACTGITGFTLKSRSGTGKIIIRSSGHADLPPDNKRVYPTYDSQHMFQLRPTSAAGVTCQSGAANYIILGIWTLPPTGTYSHNMINLNNCTDSYIDRSYIATRLKPDESLSPIRMDGTKVGVINSWIEWNGNVSLGSNVGIVMDTTDRGLIKNNYMLGGGIGVFCQVGGWPSVCRDVDVIGNTIIADDRQRKGSATNTPVGQGYKFRQLIELKSCIRCRIWGNYMDNPWYDGITATGAFLISPRMTANGTTCLSPSGRVISDNEFAYNFIVKSGTGFVYAGGHDDTNGCEPYPLQRLWIHNNIIVTQDGNHKPSGCNDPDWVADCGEQRLHWLGIGGYTDMVFENNLWYDLRNIPFAGRTLTLIDLCGDCRFNNNIGIFRDAGAGGVSFPSIVPWFDGSIPANPVDKLNELWPRHQFLRNVLRVLSPSTTAGTQGTFPANNYWPGDDATGLNAIKFTNGSITPANVLAFLLKQDSPYAPQGSSPSSTGDAVGPNIFSLLSEIGNVLNVQVTPGNTHAAFSYLAPNSDVCTIQISTSSTFASGNTFTNDSGGARQRYIHVSSLTGATLYYYRLLCRADQPTGSFTTTSSGGGETTVTVGIKPPAGSAVSDAIVDYGSTSALGSSTSPLSCNAGCSISVPATKGQALYYRIRYRDSGTNIISTGATHLIIP